MKKIYNDLPYGVKASMCFFIATFFQRGISVISTPIYTRIMPTNEYGQYNVFTSWLDIFTVFVSLKMYAGVFSSGYVKFEDKKEKFSASLQGLCFSLTVGWVCIYLLFHNQINEITSLSTVQSLAMFSLIWTTSVFSFWSVEQRADNKYVGLVTLTILVSIIKPVCGILAVLFYEDKVTARILSLAAIELIFFTVLFIKDIRRGKVFFDKKYWKYALEFNIPLIPHYLSTSILNSSDRIMIKNMVGDNEAGIYSLAYSISMLMTIFNTALYQTLEPWIFKKIKEKRTSEIGKVFYLSLSLIGIANIFLIALAPEAVKIFAPREYYEAIWVIPPVAMSVFFMFAYSIFATFEFYYEKKKYIAISTTVGALVNIVLNYFCIEKWGYIAAGYTTFVCYLLYALLHYLVMRMVCRKEVQSKVFDTRMILKITGICVFGGFGIMLAYNYAIIRCMIIGLALLFIFIKRRMIIEKIQFLLNIRKGIDER